MVMYAEIYDRPKVYCGPRRIDQGDQGPFTFGMDDKRIIDFQFTESVQETRAGGESAEAQHIPIDATQRTTLEVE
jgi:hypothetical protein